MTQAFEQPIEVKILRSRLPGEMMQTSFRDQGSAKIDRLLEDVSNADCLASEGKASLEEAANLATVKIFVVMRQRPDGLQDAPWAATRQVARADGR